MHLQRALTVRSPSVGAEMHLQRAFTALGFD
jgi:hypothetical protein